METAQLLRTLERSTVMMIRTASGGAIAYASPSTERLFGSLAGVNLANPPACEDPRSPLAALITLWDALTEAGESGEPQIVRAKMNGDPVYLRVESVEDTEGGGKLFVIADLTSLITGSEPVRRLISQLAHDLRSPLTSVAGAAELLLSGRVGSLASAQQRLVKIVDDGSHRMTDILKNLHEGSEGGCSK